MGPETLRISYSGSLLRLGFVLADRTIKLMKYLFVLSPWTLVSDRRGPSSSSATYCLHLFPHLEIIMLPNSQGCCEDQRNDVRKMFRTDSLLNVCSNFSILTALVECLMYRPLLHPTICHQLSEQITYLAFSSFSRGSSR